MIFGEKKNSWYGAMTRPPGSGDFHVLQDCLLTTTAHIALIRRLTLHQNFDNYLFTKCVYLVTADCGKRVLLVIYFYNYFDNYCLVFVPGRSRAGTNPLFQFLYQHGRVLVQKLTKNCQNNCKSKFRRRHVFQNRSRDRPVCLDLLENQYSRSFLIQLRVRLRVIMNTVPGKTIETIIK